jgi:DnaK suppressor protein
MKNKTLNIPKIKKKLLAEQQELIQISEQEQSTRAPVELDQTTTGRLSRIDAIQVQEMAKEAQRRREQRLVVIKNALKRIDEDDYFGYCAQCDELIATARLEHNPACTLCIDCAK